MIINRGNAPEGGSMTEKHITSEWTGIKGKVGAWYLNSPLRRLSEILLLGDCRSAFLSEISHRIQGNEVVLDVGAGSGYFSLPIARKLTTGKVICLDLSEEMLQRLEQKAEQKGLKNRIHIVKGEASSSGLEGESVDVVISNGVFHELSSPEAVLGEMLRVLRPSGWVVLTDFRDTRIGRWIGATHREEAHGPWSVKELEGLFVKAGLRNVKAYPVKHWAIEGVKNESHSLQTCHCRRMGHPGSGRWPSCASVSSHHW
jgi:SAM-dependent methyltransferase